MVPIRRSREVWIGPFLPVSSHRAFCTALLGIFQLNVAHLFLLIKSIPAPSNRSPLVAFVDSKKCQVVTCWRVLVCECFLD